MDNPADDPRCPQLQIPRPSDALSSIDNDDISLQIEQEAPLRLSPPTPIGYSSRGAEVCATTPPCAGPGYLAITRAATNQTMAITIQPSQVSHHGTNGVPDEDTHALFGPTNHHDGTVTGGISQTISGVQANFHRPAYAVWEHDSNRGPRHGGNQPSNVPSSISHTLPGLQASLDRHTQASYDGPRPPVPPRFISTAGSVVESHPYTNSDPSVGCPNTLPTVPTGVAGRRTSRRVTNPNAREVANQPQRSHRNRGAHPPHADREFFYFWMRKHDVVQVLPGPQRLLAESALVRLHDMGKQVLDVYELTGSGWEELGVSRAVGKKLRGAVLEFTREKSAVLEEFMEKGRAAGWFVPCE